MPRPRLVALRARADRRAGARRLEELLPRVLKVGCSRVEAAGAAPSNEAAALLGCDPGEGGSDPCSQKRCPAAFINLQRRTEAGRRLVEGSGKTANLGFSLEHLSLDHRRGDRRDERLGL